MLRMQGMLLAALVLAVLLESAFATDSRKYASYCNERYGFCVDYPAGLKMEPPPANDDGRKLYDSHGFSITASGINNALDGTLTSEMDEDAGLFDRITYRTRGKNWFILSGYKGNRILYLKTYVGGGSINHLVIEYPVHLNRRYSDIVTKMSRSFRPGDLDEAH